MTIDSICVDPAQQLARLASARDRRPGSRDNEDAVDLVAQIMAQHGWAVSTSSFPVVCWEGGSGSLSARAGTLRYQLLPSPYGTGVEASGVLVAAGTVSELEDLVATGGTAGAVLLVHGEIAKTPLVPPAFPYFAMEGHAHLYSLLASGPPAAIVTSTGCAPELAGAVDPFPLIEDGDFPVPIASVPLELGSQLKDLAGEMVQVRVEARRWPATARNVVATGTGFGSCGTSRAGGGADAASGGPDDAGSGAIRPAGRMVVTAHLDTKTDTPGALDNAAGVVVLLQLAALLDPGSPVELVAFNGEDYYSAAGEVDYLATPDGEPSLLDGLSLAVNIDAAGHRDDEVAWSSYNVEGEAARVIERLLTRPGLVSGEQWWQSDHAIFAMRGVPTIAFTSSRIQQRLAELIHTERDVASVVDPGQLVLTAEAIADLARWACGAKHR